MEDRVKQIVSRMFAAAALGVALSTGAACSDDNDPTGPSVADVVGSYTATRLTATSPLGTQDILQAGGSLTMQFAASGVVTGHITIPSQSVDENFSGTWKIDDGEVELEEVAGDLFVDDMNFSVVGNTLVGDEMFSGVRVQATLTKQ
jgi:hypothetical protein